MNAEARSRRNHRRRFAAAALIVAGTSWHATVLAQVCVGTSAELENALAGYDQSTTGNVYTIRVRTGTYTLSQQFTQHAEPQTTSSPTIASV